MIIEKLSGTVGNDMVQKALGGRLENGEFKNYSRWLSIKAKFAMLALIVVVMVLYRRRKAEWA